MRQVTAEQLYLAVQQLSTGGSLDSLAQLERQLADQFNVRDFAALGHGASLLQAAASDTKLRALLGPAGLAGTAVVDTAEVCTGYRTLSCTDPLAEMCF